MTEKISVEGLQLRVWQLDGELETIRDRIRQCGLEEIFETKSEAEDNDEPVDKIVVVLDALRTCLLQFRTRLSQLQKEAEAGLSKVWTHAFWLYFMQTRQFKGSR